MVVPSQGVAILEIVQSKQLSPIFMTFELVVTQMLNGEA